MLIFFTGILLIFLDKTKLNFLIKMLGLNSYFQLIALFVFYFLLLNIVQLVSIILNIVI